MARPNLVQPDDRLRVEQRRFSGITVAEAAGLPGAPPHTEKERA
ncbi:hypothetical protein [Ostreiculturibacter nitratireducens]